MSVLYFPAIETLEIRVKTVAGADQTIDAGEPFAKIFKRWVFPLESGTTDPNTLEDDDTLTNYVQRGITDAQDGFVGGKPFMFTVEGDNIIAYTLDFKIDTSGERVPNPDVVDDGNDMIKKLSGGAIGGDALTWEVLVTDGEVLDEFGAPVLATGPIYPLLGNDVPPRFPSPFLLPRRQDIS